MLGFYVREKGKIGVACVLTSVFDAVAIPENCASLARTVGVSTEHLSRVMPRALGHKLLTPKALLDAAVTMDVFVRLGMGNTSGTIARDLHVSVRTLRRKCLRTSTIFGPDICDYRTLLGSVEIWATLNALA